MWSRKNSRLKAENLQNLFEQNNFWSRMLFWHCSWRFLKWNTLEQLDSKWKKILGFRNLQEKLKMVFYFGNCSDLLREKNLVIEIFFSNWRSIWTVKSRSNFFKVNIFWEGHKYSRFRRYLIIPWGRLHQIFVAFSKILN